MSYSESYDRLKKQLNRRRHNKTGLIPSWSRDRPGWTTPCAARRSWPPSWKRPGTQCTAQTRWRELEQRQAQWEALEKQAALRQWRETQEDLARRRQQLTACSSSTAICRPGHPGPDAGSAELLEQARTLTQARHRPAAAIGSGRLRKPGRLTRCIPDENQLRQQAEAMTPPAMPGRPAHRRRGAAVRRPRGVGPAARPRRSSSPPPSAQPPPWGCSYIIWYPPPPAADAAQTVQTRRTALQRQTAAHLRLREDARQAEDAARTAASLRQVSTQQLQGQLVTLLAQVQPFWPEANGADGVRVALTAALRRRTPWTVPLHVQQAQIRCDAMSRHLPQPPLPDPEETLPRPVLSREQIDAALPQVRNQLREARSRVDSLTGQLRTMDSPESLQAQRDQCTRRLEALQAEYDAIALAMEALTQANTVLQTRFSPALGAETARIFSAITGGRYGKVLLDRNLSLSAQPAGDAMPRALSLLSQGAGDQLYLAVRLAICRMVLPRDKAAPLILDDALANFDDQRLAAALDWLLEESRSRQILLFTCHRREGDYLRDRAHVISLN